MSPPSRWVRLVLLAGAALGLGWTAKVGVRRLRTASHPAAGLTIEDPEARFGSNGFFELVPSIHLPTSATADDVTAVFLAVPSGGVIRGAGLALPPGSVADRVERIAGRIVDVRGARIEPGGRQTYHGFRPENPGGGGRLYGFEWPSDRPREAEPTIRAFTAEVRRREGPRAAQRFSGLFGCAGCHPTQKAGATRTGGELPRRATDSNGFYQLLATLRDEAPLEAYRARDLNVDDPFVRVRCADGRAPIVARDPAGETRVSCADDSVPIGRLDVAAALAAGDTHAGAVCASRLALARSMDQEALAAFAPELLACGHRR